eukprot:PhF_6_TR27358/c0_g1_i2/m.40219
MKRITIPDVESLAHSDRTLRSDIRREQHNAKKISDIIRKCTETAKTPTPKGKKDPFPYNKALSYLGSLSSVRMEHVRKILDLLKTSGTKPTVHTYVNAMSIALRAGDSPSATSLFKEMIAAGIKPNVVAYTAAIRASCDGFDLDNADKYFDEMRSQGVEPNVRTIQTLMRACAQLSDYERGKKYFEIAVERTPWILQSYVSILAHRLKISESIRVLEENKGLGTAQLYSTIGLASSMCRFDDVLRQMYDTCPWPNSETSANEGAKTNQTGEGKEDNDAEGTQEQSGGDKFQQIMLQEADIDFQRAIEYAQSDGPAVQPKKGGLFAAPQVYVHGNTPSWTDLRPKYKEVRLEIGSGTGDWIVHQCETNNDKEILWMSLELRVDRVFSAWTKRTFHRIPADNLALVGGDARVIMASCPADYCSVVYVNFAEPPMFYDDPTRLYNNAMLADIHRILIPGGVFQFVTDDARLAIDVATQLQQDFGSHKFESMTKGRPWSNHLPEDFGTSFFERFWTHGSQTSRYMLLYQ